MKRFIRTIAGKTVLFICCIVFLAVTAVSVIGACFCLSEQLYTYSKSEVFERWTKTELINEGTLIIYDWFYSREPSKNYDSSNLMYALKDQNGKLLANSGEENSDKYSFTIRYALFSEENKITDLHFLFSNEYVPENSVCYTVNFSFKKGFPESDIYGLMYHILNLIYVMRYWVYIIGTLAFFALVAAFITLMCVSAKRPDTDKLFPGSLNVIPFDLMVAAAAAIGIFIIYLIDCMFYDNFEIAVAFIIAALLYSNVVLGLCISVAARIKQKTLLKNTVIYRILRAIRKVIHAITYLIRSIPFIWRTAFVIAGVCFIEFIAIVFCFWEPDNYIVFWVIEKLVLIPVVLHFAIGLKKLLKSGHELANGNINHKTDTKGMLWDVKRHADDLNSISYGMTIAVNERLKSERMKTELITNVSHDIKTPLTSVINYASLIGNEPCENEKITEYTGVLVRQSERLKRLIDDLVEASKASSGNLDVRSSACDASVFITQAAGEYEQKLADAGLTLITKLPDEQIRIMADGRRMWRIFDNLMNNICKYAQSNTRVYITLEKQNNTAVFSFKNISNQSLDISDEELMERFVRGDRSRNTDGNGLGLSIAKSLAELQGGKLTLKTDGDLFKAVLKFPII